MTRRPGLFALCIPSIPGVLGARHLGLDHPGRTKRQEPPPPGLDQPGAGAPDWTVRSGSSRRSRRPPDWIIQGQVAADDLDWNIQG